MTTDSLIYLRIACSYSSRDGKCARRGDLPLTRKSTEGENCILESGNLGIKHEE